MREVPSRRAWLITVLGADFGWLFASQSAKAREAPARPKKNQRHRGSPGKVTSYCYDSGPVIQTTTCIYDAKGRLIQTRDGWCCS